MSRPIFNSLGAHYSWPLAFKALNQLFSRAEAGNSQAELQQRLSQRFNGQVRLFYKGRDAIEFCLRVIARANRDKLSGSQEPRVFTQAFTCYAIEEAILRANWQPAYVDIGPDDLNLEPATLNQALDTYGPPAALIVQHSLGQPAKISQIRQWCNQHQVVLIEDLAQAFGGRDFTGSELGTQADMIVSSFGRDKIIDAGAGGFSLIKSNQPDLHQAASQLSFSVSVPKTALIANLSYPLLSQIIRATFPFQLGKLLLFAAKRMGFIRSPLQSATKQITPMPKQLAPLVVWQLNQLNQQLNHRQKIAQQYWQELSSLTEFELPITAKQIELGANLRFPILLKDPQQVQPALTALKRKGIYLQDRWYRQPVDVSNLKATSLYQPGSCPRAEAAAEKIINLPTHQRVSQTQASNIVKIITTTIE